MPEGGFLKSESDNQPRYESGHPLVLVCSFDHVASGYHSRNRSARRFGLPKRESGLWPEKVSTDEGVNELSISGNRRKGITKFRAKRRPGR